MEPKYRIGEERFYDRYPNYPVLETQREQLGIGAICDYGLLDRLRKGVKK